MTIEYRPNNKARLKIYLGKDLHGKMMFASKTITYVDKRDAKRQHDQYKMEVLNGQVNAGANITVQALGERVIESKRTKGVEPTTLRGYENDLKRIISTLGNPQARKISPLDVEKWLDDLVDLYSVKTVKNTVSLLSQIYKYGIKWRLLTANPLDHVELPTGSGEERRILEKHELSEFVNTLREYERLDYLVAYELALFCGLRRSEILALTYDDIDERRYEVHVTKSRHRIGEADNIQKPKTKKSRRIVAVPDFLMDDIRALKKAHLNGALTRNDYLIKDTLGEPLKPNRLTDELRRFTKTHGLPPVTTHGLRHTHASLVNYLGHDMTEISAQLGHSRHSTTADIYCHMFTSAPVASRTIADDLNDLVAEIV